MSMLFHRQVIYSSFFRFADLTRLFMFTPTCNCTRPAEGSSTTTLGRPSYHACTCDLPFVSVDFKGWKGSHLLISSNSPHDAS